MEKGRAFGQRFFIPAATWKAKRFSDRVDGMNLACARRAAAFCRPRWRLTYRLDRVCIWHRSKVPAMTLSLNLRLGNQSSASFGSAAHKLFCFCEVRI